MRRLSSLLTVAAVGSVLYSGYVVAGFGATTSSPCAPPTVAVDIYAIGVIPGFFGVNNTEFFRADTCAEACKTWRGTCRGIVDDAKGCVNSALAKSTNVYLDACKGFLDEAERKACKDSFKGDLEFLKNETKFDAKAAEECCNSFFEPCIEACLAGNESLIPTCSGLTEEEGPL